MVMSFTLTNLLNPLVEQIIFPVNPPNVTVIDGAKTRSYSPMAMGDVEMWRGRHPKKYTFSAFFPGAARYGRPWAPITLWRPPIDLIYQLESWQGNSVKLLFVVTDTEVSVDTKLFSIQRVWGSGYGDATYQIELHEARSIIIPVNTDPTLVVPQPTELVIGAGVGTDTNTSGNNELPGAPARDTGTGSGVPEGSNRGLPNTTTQSNLPEGSSRTTDPPPATYTIKDGDTLTSIAITMGTTVADLQTANPGIQDPDVIVVGNTINIPNGDPAYTSGQAEGSSRKNTFPENQNNPGGFGPSTPATSFNPDNDRFDENGNPIPVDQYGRPVFPPLQP